jgi:hypothetical protein
MSLLRLRSAAGRRLLVAGVALGAAVFVPAALLGRSVDEAAPPSGAVHVRVSSQDLAALHMGQQAAESSTSSGPRGPLSWGHLRCWHCHHRR